MYTFYIRIKVHIRSDDTKSCLFPFFVLWKQEFNTLVKVIKEIGKVEIISVRVKIIKSENKVKISNGD